VFAFAIFFFFYRYHYARQNLFKRYYYGPSSLSFLHAFSVRACSTAVSVHPPVFQPERHFRRNSDCARVYNNIINYIVYIYYYVPTPITLFHCYVSMSPKPQLLSSLSSSIQPSPRVKNLYIIHIVSLTPVNGLKQKRLKKKWG